MEKRGFLDPGNSGPLAQGKCSVVMRKPSIISRVVGLGFWCRPSAVLWCVVAIVVDAVETVTGRRLRSHVLDEVLERSLPSLADFDSAPPIAVVVRAFLVGAPVDHAVPADVFRGSVQAMFCELLSGFIFLEASTAFGPSLPETLSYDFSRCSAVTEAEPTSRFASEVFQDSEPADLQISQVLESGMVRLRILGGHDRLLLDGGGCDRRGRQSHAGPLGIVHCACL